MRKKREEEMSSSSGSASSSAAGAVSGGGLSGLPSCSDYSPEPYDLEQLVLRCCDCFEGDPAEPDSKFPGWLFSASEWLTPELSELMALFVSLFQNDPLGYGQKVCSAIGFWIRHFPVHFDANPQLCRLLERLKRLATADESIPRALVDELLDISAIPSYAWLRNVSVRNPVSRHVSLCFEQWSPEDIATSMSLIDYKVLSRVNLAELKRYVRTGKLSHTPLLERSIAVFNCFSGWVQATILNKATPAERADAMTKFVHVGKHLRRQNNFNTLMAVIGGTMHSNISRLVLTRAHLAPDVADELCALTELLSYRNNYAAYRRALQKVGSRFKIPIMGVHLKDLIAFWHSTASLEEFERSRRISERYVGQLAHLLSHFLGLNRTLHNFGDANLDLINTLKVLFDINYDDRELYQLSLKREPKCAQPSAGGGTTANATSAPTATAGAANEDSQSSSSLLQQSEPAAVFADWAAGVCPQPDPEIVENHIATMVDAVFKHYDNDRDGYISRAEFEQFASNFPFLEPFGEIDSDRDGLISREEMRAHFSRLNKGAKLKPVRNGFAHNWHNWHFLTPALCVHCGKMLWMRHGVRCRDCTLAAHEQCKADAVLECRRSCEPSLLLQSPGSASSSPTGEKGGGGISSWLGVTLSPRFTALGPSLSRTGTPRRRNQEQQQNGSSRTGGGLRHAKIGGRTRTLSSSASEGSKDSKDSNSQHLDTTAGGGGLFAGTGLRLSFHRLLRRVGPQQQQQEKEKDHQQQSSGGKGRTSSESVAPTESSGRDWPRNNGHATNRAPSSSARFGSTSSSSRMTTGSEQPAAAVIIVTPRPSLASEEVFVDEGPADVVNSATNVVGSSCAGGGDSDASNIDDDNDGVHSSAADRRAKKLG